MIGAPATTLPVPWLITMPDVSLHRSSNDSYNSRSTFNVPTSAFVSASFAPSPCQYAPSAPTSRVLAVIQSPIK